MDEKQRIEEDAMRQAEHDASWNKIKYERRNLFPMKATRSTPSARTLRYEIVE